MSVKVMGAVWELDLPQPEKFVLLAYADHADHEGGSVHPGVGLVAWKTGYSEDSIRRITASLEHKLGLMELVARGGGRTASEYRICLEAFTQHQLAPRRKRGRPEARPENPPQENPPQNKGGLFNPPHQGYSYTPPTSLEPSDNDKESSYESSLSAESEADASSPPPTPKKAREKPMEVGAYLVGYLVDRVRERRATGETVLDPPEKGRMGARFRELEKEHGVEKLEMAAEYMVARAAGEIDPAKPHWCYVDTALREVLDGWRPKANLRAVASPEAEKEREELDREWAEILGEVH